MSAISFSNNYVSSTYYASAKGQHAASTETVSNNNNGDVVSPAGDVLTISAEALEALNNSGEVLTITAEELEGEEKVKTKDLQKPKERKIFTSFKEYVAEIVKHSNHVSLTDWAFSLTSKNEYEQTKTSIDRFTTTYDKTQTQLAYSRYQSSLKNADEIFTELLKKNGITLNEKEHIELTIDYDGKVTVSGNISQEKSELIQNTLDNDKSLGQNLLMAHINHNNVDISPFGYYGATNRIPVNIILQQEYDLSLSDFELNEDFDPRQHESYESLKIKNGNDSLIKELYNNEGALFCQIAELLRKQKKNPDAELPSTTFSYQNGVFVEKGKNDVTALDSFASKAAKYWEILWDRVDYSMTFNSNGEIIDVAEDKTQTRNFGKSLKETILQYNKDSLDESTQYPKGGHFNALILQQYAFDKKRLTQYETGANTDDLDTFTVGKNEKGNFSIASNSTLLREITKSATENPTEKIDVNIPRRYGR